MGGGRWIIVTLAMLGVLIASPGADAGWLSRLLQEAGEAGGKVARHGAGTLDNVAAHLKLLPPPGPKGATLGATVSQEGHWTFTNLAGERFTVGTPGEMQRIARVLAPEAGQSKLTLLLPEDALFINRAHIDLLPKDADLRVLVGKESYLLRRPSAAGGVLQAEIRPNLLLPVGDQRMFREAVWQLARPIIPTKIRVLALEPSGPKTLSPAIRTDPVSKQVLSDTIDPKAFADAIRAIPGQTVVISGRVEGRTLHFRPADGSEHSLAIDDLIRAAAGTDVNVVVLHAKSPRQPGARNWLWQRIEIAGLKLAMKRPTTADFLNAVADADAPLSVTASSRANGRVAISVHPQRTDALSPPTDSGGGVASTIITELTGKVATSALEMDLTSSEREKELEMRIVPGVPSYYQYIYIAFVALGVIGWPAARLWWRLLWPPKGREGYRSAALYNGMRFVRFAIFLLFFLPVVALPAAVMTFMLQVWAVVSWPFKKVTGLLRQRAATNA